jgi:hypothetical protein
MDINSECFKCPISREIMRDPVLASDGNSYERIYLETWVKAKGNYSPMTREKIKKDLIPNRAMKDAIEFFREKEKKEKKDDVPGCMKRELLTKLCEDNNFMILEKLLKDGFFGTDIESISEQAVVTCLWKNYPTPLAVLIDYGAKVDWETAYPFLHKIRRDYNKLLNLVSDKNENLNNIVNL